MSEGHSVSWSGLLDHLGKEDNTCTRTPGCPVAVAESRVWRARVSKEVSVPVEDQAHLPAEPGSLLIEDAAAHAEPPALDERGPGPGRAVVEGGVVLPLGRRAHPSPGIDGVPARGDVEVAAEPLGKQPREVAGCPEQHGLLVGAVEVPVH